MDSGSGAIPVWLTLARGHVLVRTDGTVPSGFGTAQVCPGTFRDKQPMCESTAAFDNTLRAKSRICRELLW